jgi:glycosyltransferase involved in cell wall biosynthesis
MLADNLVRNGIDGSRVELLPLYAAPGAAPKKPLQKPTALQPAQRRFILHPGGLVRHKGAWLLVRNIEQLPDDVDIVFAGSGGELQPALERYVAEHRVSERVRIMGVVSPAQWSALFHQAAVVVLPSFWNEPLGLAGIYAMAHSKPVVAFRSGGIDEWLEHGVTGIAVPFGARDAFVEAVVKLLNDWDLQKSLSSQAHDAWDARFRPEHHLANLRNYYARLASQGKVEIRT